MRLSRSGEFYFAFFFLILVLLLVGMAFTYDPQAALVPLVIGIPTILLLVLELVRHQSPTLARLLDAAYFRREEQGGTDGEAEKPKPLGLEITALLTITGYAALVMAVGFHLAIPLYVIFYCFLFARAPWWKALLVAATTWGFIYLVFCIALGVKFPGSFVF